MTPDPPAPDPLRVARVLVVTDDGRRTAALLDTIRGRAARGPAEFGILVPNPAEAEWHPGHPERHDKVTRRRASWPGHGR